MYKRDLVQYRKRPSTVSRGAAVSSPKTVAVLELV